MEIKQGSFYYNKKKVFEDVNIKTNKGDIIAIVGSNGSGKTTLLKCMANILQLTSGELIIKNDSRSVYVPDVPLAYEYLTGYEYLAFIQSIIKDRDSKKIESTLKLYTLYEERNKLIKNYSYGMKQKLSLCAALLDNDIEYILLDEPLTGVDKQSQSIIIENLKKLSFENKTIILTTHQIDSLQKVCNKIYCMDSKNEVHIDV